jgi:DNA (cytosine-5)-methyltransferase 1
VRRYADICAGISAATVAWKPLGWSTAFYAEVDKFPSAVLRHHYPTTPNLGDITRFEDWPDASLDVLIGGTPCQGFSVAGLRKGMDDDRSNLALCFGRIAQRYQPRWLVWENVPGVRSSGEGRDLGAFLRGLGELGYGLAWRSLDAQYAGLAQRRERLFVVGHLGDWRPAAAVLLEREGLRWDSAPRREAGQGTSAPVAGSLNSSVGRGTGGAHETDFLTLAKPVLAGGHANNPLDENLIAHSLRADGFDASGDGTGRGTPIVPIAFNNTGQGWWNDTNVASGLRDMSAGSGSKEATLVAFSSKDYGADAGSLAPTLRAMGHDGSHANAGGQVAVAFGWNKSPSQTMRVSDTTDALQASPQSNPAVAFAQNQAGEVRTSDLMGTLNTNANASGRATPMVAQGWAVRRLTPGECEALQGFPRGYTDIPWRGKPNAPDGPRYKALGNSIAVPCLRWIGERIELCEDVMREVRSAAA